MVNRRIVLKLGGAGVMGAILNLPGQPLHATRVSSHGSRRRAVFDERFEDSLAFAGELNRGGVVASGIRGDVAELWYEDLRTHLREGPAPIAGLTDRTALFCLEELVRDVGLKVFFRVDHLIDPNGYVRHRGFGPASLVEAVRYLAPRPGFGQIMARLASHVDFDETGDIAALKRTGPHSPEGRTALVSWVIA